MKIGIITYWDTEDNYGQVLQCYALISYLKEKGHEPFLIRTKLGDEGSTSFLHKMETVLTLLSKPSSVIKLFRRKEPLFIDTNIRTDRKFSEFKKKNIPYTERIYTFFDLCHSQFEVDAIICGSDQVWSGISPLMFLQFPGNFMRIAYAASFGGFKPVNLTDKWKLKKWLNTFSLVTLREQEGLEICKRMCKNAFIVPDPTLIVNRGIYDNINHNAIIENKSPYILLYLLGNKMEVNITPIYNMAKENGLDVIYVASQGRTDDYEKTYPTIEEWLSLVHNASYIITNSFHGTVFSLIYNVPFLSLLLSGSASRMNSRITELLDRYGLSERVFHGDYKSLFDNISFDYFNKKKIEDIEFVDKLLTEVIK